VQARLRAARGRVRRPPGLAASGAWPAAASKRPTTPGTGGARPAAAAAPAASAPMLAPVAGAPAVGFGRIVVSEIDAPIILVNLVLSG
jgi:hypothetical protein